MGAAPRISSCAADDCPNLCGGQHLRCERFCNLFLGTLMIWLLIFAVVSV